MAQFYMYNWSTPIKIYRNESSIVGNFPTKIYVFVEVTEYG